VNDRNLVRLLADAVENLDRSAGAIEAGLVSMHDALNGHPRSPALDSVGGRGRTTFCEVHERERCACGGGTPYENLTDPTGDAATRPDRAAVDRRRLEDALRSIGRQAEDVVRLLAKYQARPASDRERAETLKANERDVSCWSCARDSGHWAPAARSAELLGERRQLCWWCFDWVRKGDGSAPSLVQVRQYHDTGRVRRPA
jgi:hypothetical protein